MMETTTLKVFCNNCKRITNHEILKEEERTIIDKEVQVMFYDNWQIIKCLGCEEILFRHSSSNSDAYNEETCEDYISSIYYPFRNDNSISIKKYYNVPSIIKNIYVETIHSYNYGLRLLCAAGIRAIIESICANENILNGLVEEKAKTGILRMVRKKDLRGKINGLEEKGIITKKQTAILHEHRFLGNEAIHSFEIPNKKVLKIAIEIIENILDSLYEIDEKANELTLRRELIESRKKKN